MEDLKSSLVQTITKQQSSAFSFPADITVDSYQQINRCTGISLLDRTLGGGLPSGSVAYIYADAKSSAEVFLYQFTQARKTYYFSTERRSAFITRDMKNCGFNTKDITFVDIYNEYYVTPHGEMVDNLGNEFVDSKIIEYTEHNLEKIMGEDEKDVNIIFDSFSFYLSLNLNPGVIKRLINIIYEVTKNLNCVSFLYGIKGSRTTSLENEILKACDVIFDVDLEKATDRLSNRLSIPKIRGKVPTTELIRFKVGDGIQIDTTRDIA
jgi:KaiC/GvpD/RAD55 family RecA-like ATPase